jgi:hypothetical protein
MVDLDDSPRRVSPSGGSATRLVAVGLSGRAVVASFAGVALGWRLETALGVVVVVERVRRVVELACLVVGEPGGARAFITEEDARRALEDCLRDEPKWRGLLEVTEVELDHEHTSLN